MTQKDTYYEVYCVYDNSSLVSYGQCNTLEEARARKIAFEKYYIKNKFIICRIMREIIE